MKFALKLLRHTSLLAGLLGQKHRVDVGKNTTGRDCHTAKQLVELFIVADGELKVAGNDARLLVIAGRVSGQLEDLSGEILHDGSEVHGSTSTDAGRVLACLEVAGNTAHGELKTGLRRLRHGLLAALAAASATLTLAGHDELCFLSP